MLTDGCQCARYRGCAAKSRSFRVSESSQRPRGALPGSPGGDGSVWQDTGEGPPLPAPGRLPDPGLAWGPAAAPGAWVRDTARALAGAGAGRAQPARMPAASRSREGSSGVWGKPGVTEAADRRGPQTGIPPALPLTRRLRAVQLSREEGGPRSWVLWVLWVLGTGRDPQPNFRSSPPSPGVSCAPDF